MPTIELQKPRSNKDRQYKPKDQNLWAQEIYTSTLWRRLRQSYLMSHPLCEICQEQDIITPATDVHHQNEISNAGSRLEAYDIGYDSNNLMALCHKCHQRYHAINHSVHGVSKEDSIFLEKYNELCKRKNTLNKHQ